MEREKDKMGCHQVRGEAEVERNKVRTEKSMRR